ncbi:unnamed protein product [Arabidopsis halleri]
MVKSKWTMFQQPNPSSNLNQPRFSVQRPTSPSPSPTTPSEHPDRLIGAVVTPKTATMTIYIDLIS